MTMLSSVMRPPRGPNTMPETSAYFHAAYTIALGIYAAYALSLYVRLQRVRGK
jgi:hypothetical protein